MYKVRIVQAQQHYIPSGDLVGGGETIVGDRVFSGVGTTMSAILHATPDQQYEPTPHSACTPDLQ